MGLAEADAHYTTRRLKQKVALCCIFHSMDYIIVQGIRGPHRNACATSTFFPYRLIQDIQEPITRRRQHHVHVRFIACNLKVIDDRLSSAQGATGFYLNEETFG
jgi:hypothetical protein